MSWKLVGRSAIALAAMSAPAHGWPPPRPARPNFVVILVDDLRADDFGAAGRFRVATPNIDRLAMEGTRFVKTFTVQPLCSPSRASFLTGLYPHNHGIIDNGERGPRSHQLKTFPQNLRLAGYETAFIGKWHMGHLDDSPRPGFDHWVSFKGQGSAVNPELNENGSRASVLGYTTDILTDRAVRFLERRRQKPFLLYLAHKQIHPNVGAYAVGGPGYVPAERHRGRYSELPIPRSPSAGVPPSDKPALLRHIDSLPPLGPATQTSDDEIRLRLESELAVDESVGRILATLEQIGHLDNTVVVFAGDNGYFYGEHGLSFERRLAYEESARIPFIIRHPPTTKAGAVREELVLNVDLAPTVLELAGAGKPQRLDGRSLVPLLRADRPRWRSSILIEHFSEGRFPRTRNLGYQAVRTGRLKYIRYLELRGMDELYDLAADPYELRNVIAHPEYAAARRELQAELKKLLAKSGASH